MSEILCTGHRGFIGSRLIKALKQEGHVVHGIDFKCGQDVLTCDLPQVDCVYHLAAQSGALPSMEDPLNDARNNILGTIRIAKRYKHIPIVYTTSGASLAPESPYGLSKKVGEEYLHMLADHAIICRLSSVYGEKPKGVVDTFIREKKCLIRGDGNAMRDFVHVDDIIKGLLLARKWIPGEYSFGSGMGTKIKDIARATGKEIEHTPRVRGEKLVAILENTTPNWEPEIDVIEYVRSKS